MINITNISPKLTKKIKINYNVLVTMKVII